MDFLEKQFGRLGNRLFQMAYLYSQFRDGIIPDFYLQDQKYFEKYTQEIKQLFGADIKKSDYIAIHVRRTDYIDNPFYIDLTKTDYYKNAITLFPGETFLVFSDDIDWCEGYFLDRQIPRDKFAFSKDKTAEEDLMEMAGCKAIIMANSSLSWWGAFLGEDGRKVVYPRQWFADGIKRVGFPKGWICI